MGDGKTFAMPGSKECPRVIAVMFSDLYQRVDELRSDGQCDVAVAYFEVEVVRHLLYPGGSPLADCLLGPLLRGNRNLTQHATDAESSRPDAIF
ncbi:kinesin-like protein KIF18B [Haemaphysalis longicornis]